jgi:UDP-N-acetylmuramoyl-L-alanyl-D-glutamate--2,6-diaminopimelate ligase
VIRVSAVLARLQAAGLLLPPGPQTELAVTGITDDSRQVRAGELYVAVRGHAADGHRYLRDAARAGALAALVETPQPGLELLQIRVRDTRRAAAVAAQLVYGDPAAALTLVGVTGTNGKTTTVHLARHILSRSMATASLGTLGVIAPDGTREDTQLTTPGPVEFARRLAQLRRSGAACVVAEVSSHALAQGRVDGVRFAVAAFTNLTRDHLDYHQGFEEYLAAKLRLVELMKDGGALVVNADEPSWASLRERPGCLRYGLGEGADYRARALRLGPDGSRWTLSGPSAEVEARLPLIGEFNVSNALAAVCVATALGLGLAEATGALATAPLVPGRLEVLAEAPLVLRDYAHTPDALRHALAALRPLVRGRLLVVFGCGGDRDPGKRPLMGVAVAEGADYAFVTSDNPRSESPEAIIEAILPGLGAAPHEVIVDRRRAIARALEVARPDDAVLLAGKGHEVYQIVGSERRPFDEATIVRETLAMLRGSERRGRGA